MLQPGQKRGSKFKKAQICHELARAFKTLEFCEIKDLSPLSQGLSGQNIAIQSQRFEGCLWFLLGAEKFSHLKEIDLFWRFQLAILGIYCDGGVARLGALAMIRLQAASRTSKREPQGPSQMLAWKCVRAGELARANSAASLCSA